jgi:SAM-dependent methyltransferase
MSEGARPVRSQAPPNHGQAVLAEFERSGLDLDRIGGNSGKLRLSLDLATLIEGSRRIRILDVGCAGPTPLNLWEPFAPLADQLDLVGVDVRGIARAKERARELRLPIRLYERSAFGLTEEFGTETFDAVVSTQVLEHLRDWQGALGQMRDVLRPGGTIFLTCDSGHVQRPLKNRVRLHGKRAYAVMRASLSIVGRVGDRYVSGEWEKGQTVTQLRGAAQGLGLAVERLTPYSIRDLKRAQRHTGSATRQLWLALEEELAHESSMPVDLGLYTVIYLRARRSGEPAS